MEEKITENPSGPEFVEAPQREGWCSENVCSKGHKWIPTVGIAKCPGCQAPVLMVLMENCPWCAEPVEGLKLRTDHAARGLGVAMACKGQLGSAEMGVIELRREHAREIEVKEKKDEPLLERGNNEQ